MTSNVMEARAQATAHTDTPASTPRRLVGTQEARDRLRVGRTSLYKFIRKGIIPAPKRLAPKTRRLYWTEAEFRKIEAVFYGDDAVSYEDNAA